MLDGCSLTSGLQGLARSDLHIWLDGCPLIGGLRGWEMLEDDVKFAVWEWSRWTTTSSTSRRGVFAIQSSRAIWSPTLSHQQLSSSSARFGSSGGRYRDVFPVVGTLWAVICVHLAVTLSFKLAVLAVVCLVVNGHFLGRFCASLCLSEQVLCTLFGNVLSVAVSFYFLGLLP